MKRIWESRVGGGDKQEAYCSWDTNTGLLEVKGDLGKCVQVFKGSDIVLGSEYIFCKSKSSKGYVVSRMKGLLEGVKRGYYIELEATGRSYMFINLMDRVLLKFGWMHYLKYKVEDSVKVFGSKEKIVIFGLDIEEVHRVAAILRAFKVRDAYKGKGISYVGEKIVLKVGKVGKAGKK